MTTDADSFSIEAYFPNYYAEGGVALTMSSILGSMANASIDVRANVLACEGGPRPAFIRPLMHRRVYRWMKPWIKNPGERLLKASQGRLRPFDVAYMWLQSPEPICADLKSRDVLVVREMINSTQERRREELANAYRAFGSGESGITDEIIDSERRQIFASDFVFCPNPFVKESVVAYGYPAERCIATSYGWSQRRLSGTTTLLNPDDTFTVVFVGTVDIRKGAPVLLEAWAKSKVKGRLLLAGAISPEVGEKYAAILQRDDVKCLGYVTDIGPVYRSASVFCLPTWEEGGPQVTLEAMSQGVVPIVTPMGTAGAFTANEDVGVVVPAGDVDGFAEALRRLEQDTRYRQALQSACRVRAQ